VNLKDRNLGFAVTGSFCTFGEILPVMRTLTELGAKVFPIFSYHTAQLDTRFFQAADFRARVIEATGREPWTTLMETEPIGPKRLLDLVILAPCTGNSLAKLAQGITDTPALMAAKSQLRNGGPVVVAVASNDTLTNNAKNLGMLLNMKNVYLVPLRQDDPFRKPASIIAAMERIPETCKAALKGMQIQPLLYGWEGENV